MNKELEEAIKICNDFVEENKTRKIILHKAIETVLKALENSIPKEVIEKKIKEYKKDYKTKYDVGFGKNWISKEQQDIEKQIKILQELLEEK